MKQKQFSKARLSSLAGRSNLMEQIRNAGGFSGAGLHKAGERKSAGRSPSPGHGGGGDGGDGSLNALLQGAFAKIKEASAMSSDEDGEDSSEDWSEEDC